MRNIILSTLASALIAAATMQTAVAAERHHVRHTDRTVAAEQFRNANNAMPSPATSPWPYSGFSAPAGR